MAAGAYAPILHLNLSAAAKLLWRELRDLHGKRSHCWAGQETLAERLGCGLRTVSRAIAELKKAGLVAVEQRGQGRTAHYFLKSTGIVDKPVENRGNSAQMALDLAGLGTPTVACPSMSITSGLGKNQSECTIPESPAGSATDSLQEHRKTQRQAVERAVEAAGIEPTKDVIDKLARKAAFYGANGFQVAAAVHRCLARIENAPSLAPLRPAWVLKCVENEFFAQFGDTRQKKPPTFETSKALPVSDETVTERASRRQEYGAQREAATANDQAHETPCRLLASSGNGVRGDPWTGTSGEPESLASLHETNPAWSDRAPPADEFAAAIFQLAREKCLDARRVRAG